ncbi:Golgi membrane protein 1-like isoform X2 [Acipenser oxyrinchus oxyrinchus]|uniref:Golgi membrane protein 1-like isoform X2 n=1 Tax=Acipenser oxyrinchus oxyrinchus TaxID=40147 RepID=A0AAD8GL64_ACIOX|nr:Golgi membrane protein 1-like isoform X2 [Acipenser oxyrinchus oxyrinchus]
MVGLGNSRRGGRSPPILIGALIASLVVLGFNYWISNSRNIELQTRVYELEAKVRRAAAERSAVELKKNEFHGQLEKQKEQINRIESLHKEQLESAHKSWKDDKALLQLNISLSTASLQKMKDEYNNMLKDYGKLQKELQECQRNQSSLQKKLTYDMTQCNVQITELKEQYEEKLLGLSEGMQQKADTADSKTKTTMVKLSFPTAEKGKVEVDENKDPVKNELVLATSNQGPSQSANDQKKETATQKAKNTELETNEIPKDTGEAQPLVPHEKAQIEEDQSKLKGSETPAVMDVVLQEAEEEKNGGEVEDVVLQEAEEEKNGGEVEDVVLQEAEEEKNGGEVEVLTKSVIKNEAQDPEKGIDKVNVTEEEEEEEEELIHNGLEIFDDSPNRDHPDEPVIGNKINDGNLRLELEKYSEGADYNGDDDNVGEFEADKQAELSENTDTDQKKMVDLDQGQYEDEEMETEGYQMH